MLGTEEPKSGDNNGSDEDNTAMTTRLMLFGTPFPRL